MFDICVFAGRFRPFHAGHLHVITEALTKAQYAFVIVGSAGEPVNFRNPFTFEEVREMIRASLAPVDADRVFILPMEDHDNDIRWVQAVQRVVTSHAKHLSFGHEPRFALIGHNKDGSSYYLKLFPQWDSVAVSKHSILDATTLRVDLYELEDEVIPTYLDEVRRSSGTSIWPQGTYLFLREWLFTSRYRQMRDEFRFMRDYLSKFPQTPYPRYFTAADACAIMAGHVLLVRRGAMPGEGLWALPGGHVDIDETFQKAAIRELLEETGLMFDETYLLMACKGEKLLDNPWRSTRKRTISVAYGFEFIGVDLPAVRGLDDARTARWWPLDEVTREMMFEDHFGVIQHFATRFNSTL